MSEWLTESLLNKTIDKKIPPDISMYAVKYGWYGFV